VHFVLFPQCRDADPVSLRLLANLADRVPGIMGKTNLTDIFQSAISTLQSSLRPDALEALTEAICNVAVATENKSSCLGPERNVTVDSACPASRLGTTTLPFVFNLMEKIIHKEALLQKCLQHLAHAASTCPSLLAGDVNVFLALVRTCLKVTTTCTLDLALSAMQVLASLCAVEFVKRHILTTSAPIRNLILDNVLRVCAQLIVNGVDDDDAEEWASEPATIMVRRIIIMVVDLQRIQVFYPMPTLLRCILLRLLYRTMCQRGKATTLPRMRKNFWVPSFSHWVESKRCR
jgi:ribosomal protein S7